MNTRGTARAGYVTFGCGQNRIVMVSGRNGLLANRLAITQRQRAITESEHHQRESSITIDDPCDFLLYRRICNMFAVPRQEIIQPIDCGYCNMQSILRGFVRHGLLLSESLRFCCACSLILLKNHRKCKYTGNLSIIGGLARLSSSDRIFFNMRVAVMLKKMPAA